VLLYYFDIGILLHIINIMIVDLPSDRAVFPVVFRSGGIWRQGCGNHFAYVNDSHVAKMRLGII
jgi:hypothetical protein